MTPLEIVAYDPQWPAQFARERARLAAALGAVAVRIDHNGSTSVPGLASKPVIDIQVSVAAVQPMDPYLPVLERLGYVHLPHADDAFCPYFHRPSAWPHSHHVHVVEAGGVEEARTLAFRDYLRAHPAVADAYARLKRGLAPEFSAAEPEARQAYADAKGAFIERIIATALAEGYPRGRG
ncbi:MAG TPA: GrpB family protein [Candidatus Dormibacteraeota bacterium]|nr:GrpB family protein [Candidatus Dormibacteraeota bacterium]